MTIMRMYQTSDGLMSETLDGTHPPTTGSEEQTIAQWLNHIISYIHTHCQHDLYESSSASSTRFPNSWPLIGLAIEVASGQEASKTEMEWSTSGYHCRWLGAKELSDTQRSDIHGKATMNTRTGNKGKVGMSSENTGHWQANERTIEEGLQAEFLNCSPIRDWKLPQQYS